ncbi:MAG: hypothetical protein IPL72_11710 [Sulfuritalea sp.]|nr:hypothetical protein [Sulfuritalea sp.]
MVLAQALADRRVAEVVALTRRPLTDAPKLKNIVVDFDRLPERADWWAVDAVVIIRSVPHCGPPDRARPSLR